ncbi:MAG: hypothetical protein R3A52_00625 [Polyangiales bacterium]
MGRSHPNPVDSDPPPIDEDPWQAWIQTHREEYLSHAGRVVGIHPTRGIVASARTAGELLAELARIGLTPADEVLVSRVVPPGVSLA